MDDIFAKEESIVKNSEQLLVSKVFSSPEDEENYEKLLDEYRKMLKQVRSLVKMADMMQWKLNSMSSQLERLSNIDELTGLFNRRFFNETYEKEWRNATRLQSPLGILMADIDFFKSYNDTFGHLQGDWCLKKIAQTIKESVKRPRDFVSRFGGEEFIVLLPDTDLEGCAVAAERILGNIASLDISRSLDDSEGKVSISIGISAMIPNGTMGVSTLLHQVDEALYRAKRAGRNCYKV